MNIKKLMEKVGKSIVTNGQRVTLDKEKLKNRQVPANLDRLPTTKGRRP